MEAVSRSAAQATAATTVWQRLGLQEIVKFPDTFEITQEYPKGQPGPSKEEQEKAAKYNKSLEKYYTETTAQEELIKDCKAPEPETFSG